MYLLNQLINHLVYQNSFHETVAVETLAQSCSEMPNDLLDIYWHSVPFRHTARQAQYIEYVRLYSIHVQ